MTHDHHQTLPGYDERQIWVDHCSECEGRSKRLPFSLPSLDAASYIRAKLRASDWSEGVEIGFVSEAELPLLEILSCIQMLEKRVAQKQEQAFLDYRGALQVALQADRPPNEVWGLLEGA